MKKFVKLSLVAAVAVAGLTTTASAQSASDAIKNVSVKGFFEYRWEKDVAGNKYYAAGINTDSNKFRIQATAKANDTVSMTLRATDGVAGNDTGTKGLDIDRKYLTVKAAGASILLGNFTDPTPFTDGASINGEAVIYSPSKALTLIGAYYHVNAGAATTTASANIMGAAVLGNTSGINYALWYAKKENSSKNLFASVGGKVAGVKLELAYGEKKPDAAAKTSQTRLVASGKLGMVSFKAAAIKVGKNGSRVGILTPTATGLDDGDEKAGFTSSKLTLGTINQAIVASKTASYIKVGAALTSNIGASLEYFKVGKFKDTTAKLTYKIAKNTSSYIRYSTGNYTETNSATKDKDIRISVKYSF